MINIKIYFCYEMLKINDKVKSIMTDAITKNKEELEAALVKPISDDYLFSTNGIYFLLGKIGSGKTYFVWKHILTTELIGIERDKKPYYDLVLFCSTSGALDKTSETFAKRSKSRIKYLKEHELMKFLEKHLRRKQKYYAIVKHALSNFVEVNEEMARIIKKYRLEDLEERIQYIIIKLRKYNTTAYPFNTLLVLDDFAASPLLRKPDSPLIRMLTKTRHYNLTCIIIAQTIRFVPLNLKRLATDLILYAKYSDEDFLSVLEQTPNNLNKKQALTEYKKLTNSHDHVIINITADQVEYVKN